LAQDVTGLHVEADGAATAANASLVSTNLSGLDGAPIGNRTVALPSGFSISIVADGLKNPRFMQFDEAGNLLVADDDAGRIYRYSGNGGATAPTSEPPAPLIDNLGGPSSVALHDGYLYVGETRTISRYAYDPNGSVGDRQAIVPDLPRGGHNTRTVLF